MGRELSFITAALAVLFAGRSMNIGHHALFKLIQLIEVRDRTPETKQVPANALHE